MMPTRPSIERGVLPWLWLSALAATAPHAIDQAGWLNAFAATLLALVAWRWWHHAGPLPRWLPPLLWGTRIVLLVSVALHIWSAVTLAGLQKRARPVNYVKLKPVTSSYASRTMYWSGPILFLFIVYHLLHFTVRIGNDYATYKTTLHGETVHDVYRMVIAGFSWPPASIFYLIAMALLCSHLSHGFSSVFQTLGISTDKSEVLFKRLGRAFAGLIFVGNSAIVLAIWLFGYGR